MSLGVKNWVPAAAQPKLANGRRVFGAGHRIIPTSPLGNTTVSSITWLNLTAPRRCYR